MYYIRLDISGRSLVMNPSSGFLISTIDGLTGVTSRLETVQAANGIGETVTGGTVQGTNITIRGKILDHNVTAKQALLDTAIPMGIGTLTVYNYSNIRPAPYRVIEVVVQTAPKIEQKTHSKFSLALRAPSATWYSTERKTISLDGASDATYNNEGHYPSDYSLSLEAVNPVRQMTLYLDGISPTSKYLYMNFTKYSANGVTGKIYFGRERGKLYLRVGTDDALYCLSAQSTLWALPPGEHTLTLSAGTPYVYGTVQFAAAYAGVVLSGI